MTIVGFGFTKINVEKKENMKGKVNINNNVTIKDLKEKELGFAKDQKGLEFTFEFLAKYEPDIGEISLIGTLLFMTDQKTAKEAMEQWKKDKKISKELMTAVLNHVLMKSNIQALILSQEIGLPPPIPLPKIQPKEADEKKYIG